MMDGELPQLLAGAVVINVVLALALIGILAWPGFRFAAPWDGPAIATLMLSVSAVVLTGVAVIAALLSVWGFTTLREHVGNIARDVAREAMQPAAEAAAERVVKQQGNRVKE